MVECMRAREERRKRRGRDFVIRTRPELVSVRNKSSNFSVRSSWRGLQFLLAPSRTLIARSDPVPFPVEPRGASAAPLPRRNARAIVTQPESFADRSRVPAETAFSLCFFLALPPPPAILPSARNLSHSSSTLRFVKSYASTFVA